MNTEIKSKWIDALKSEEYTQVKFNLIFVDKNNIVCHCANGVLVDLYLKENHLSWSSSISHHGKVCGKFEEFDILPEEVIKWAKIDMKTSFEIQRLNDRLNKSFTQIADYIATHKHL